MSAPTTTEPCPRLKRALRRRAPRRSSRTTLGLGNIMEVPRLEKIVVNMGVGEAARAAVAARGRGRATSTISPARSRSSPRPRSRSPASSSARATPSAPRSPCAATACGSSSTGSISLAIPRIRDFRGLPPAAFDGRGNYTFGVTEQLIFPEIDYDKVDATRGMDITIVTTARTDAEGKALLDAFGFPFKREGQQ